MNLETRDQLDTLLDDARKALDKAERLLSAEFAAKCGFMAAPDWTVYGRIHGAGSDVRGAIEALPTVHSLQAGETHSAAYVDTSEQRAPSVGNSADSV